jgi:hypothetical protein
MNSKNRLERVRRAVKPEREIVVYFYDYENVNAYTEPPEQPGAQLVTQAEILETMKTKTVLLVKYEHQARKVKP